MPIRIQLDGPDAVAAFLDYFSATDCAAVRESETTVRLTIRDAPHAKDERLELDRRLARWRLANPDTEAHVVD
jgi:hypothetical protein